MERERCNKKGMERERDVIRKGWRERERCNKKGMEREREM